ncbi:uncharacterized protein LOC124139970 isoform X2 [Haliotis rufescens]|uniref:uncharacterized protein LOC124139970 isoform X2 n=1 Tax=Haliotis rufescens TaxID=6454 RepID=UPI00201E9A08|nr:uncharacterized protein LOC124139970 isoform X2 [Haliotis rufescens]
MMWRGCSLDCVASGMGRTSTLVRLFLIIMVPVVRVVTMCQSGEVTTTSLFINANTMVHEHEVCSCTISQFSGEMEIFALPGTVISDCTVKLNFYERLSTTNAAIYSLHCLQDRSFTETFASTQEILLNLTGLGTLDICIGIRNTAKKSKFKIACSPRVQIRPDASRKRSTISTLTTATGFTGYTGYTVSASSLRDAASTDRSPSTSSTSVTTVRNGNRIYTSTVWVMGGVGIVIVIFIVAVVIFCISKNALSGKNDKDETE